MTWRERLELIQDYVLMLWLAVVEVLQWLSDKSAEFPPLSWFIHAVLAVPLAFLAPWCPLVVYGYREVEQAIDAHVLNDEPVTAWVAFDRFMDVFAPALVGWWLG